MPKDEFKAEDVFVDREMALKLLESGYTQRQIAVILGKSESLLKAYKRGFRSQYEYSTRLILQQTNPETGEPFRSRAEYRARFKDRDKWRTHGKRISDLADDLITDGPIKQMKRPLRPEGEATRKRISDYIAEHPGSYFNEIKLALDLNVGTMQHHLHVLENQRAVESVRTKGYLYYFPKGHVDKTPLSSQQRVMEAIATHKNIRQYELGQLLGLTHATVSYHISNLEKMGLVVKEKLGNEVRYKSRLESA